MKDKAIYRSRMLTVRLREHECEAIDTAAKVAKLRRSEWVRAVLLKAARRITQATE